MEHQPSGFRSSPEKWKTSSFAYAEKSEDRDDGILNGGGLSMWWILQDTADVAFDPTAEDEAAEAGNDSNKVCALLVSSSACWRNVVGGMVFSAGWSVVCAGNNEVGIG